MNKVQLQELILKWVNEEIYKSLPKISKWVLKNVSSERLTNFVLRNIKITHEKIENKKHGVKVTVRNKNRIVAIREFALEKRG